MGFALRLSSDFLIFGRPLEISVGFQIVAPLVATPTPFIANCSQGGACSDQPFHHDCHRIHAGGHDAFVIGDLFCGIARGLGADLGRYLYPLINLPPPVLTVKDSHEKRPLWKRKPSKVKTPSILGAYIYLGDCFDLLDIAFTSVLETVYPAFVADLESRGESVPKNERPRTDGTKLFHALDRSVIEFAIKLSEEAGGRKFDTVRGAFWKEGRPFPAPRLPRSLTSRLPSGIPSAYWGISSRKVVDRTGLWDDINVDDCES